MKCTCSDSGAFAGAVAVRNLQCEVCMVQCAACQDSNFAVDTEWVKL